VRVTAFSWPAAEAAIVTAIAAATGITPTWVYQNTQPPPAPALLLARLSLKPLDRNDEQVIGYSASQPLNRELTVQTTQWWLMTLGIHARATIANLLGPGSPEALLAQALTYLEQESVQATLDGVGLGFRSIGDVVTDPDVFSAAWQPSASATMTFVLPLFAIDYEGYIATYQVSQT
jgi:hypothetical protein